MNKSHDTSFAELEALISLGTHKSVRSAARNLRLKPSHLSKILARLETKLGRTLFIRTNSGLIATREGVEAVRDAARVIALAEKSSLLGGADRSKEESSVHTIGSLSFINRWLLAPCLMADEKIEKTSQRWRLLDLPPDLLVSSALQGAFDMAINTDQKVWPRSWDVKVVGTIRWRVYSRLQHPLGKAATLAEILKYPFVIPTYWQKDGYAAGDDLFPIPISERIRGMEVSTADTSAVICSKSNQVAFLPDILGSSNSTLQMIKVGGLADVERNIVLACKSDRVSNGLRNAVSGNIKNFLRDPSLSS